VTCDIVVVNYNTDFYLYNLLASIRERLPSGNLGSVIVWDNASQDASASVLAAFAAEVPWLRWRESPVNVYHGPALDRLIREHAAAEWVLVLDSDTEVRANFFPDLPPLTGSPPAFVGQITPAISQFYASLFHLLVNRPWYLRLPPFRHHGAPGVDLFRYIDEHRIPYRRFRWTDYIEHFGQGTLRSLHERGDRENEFFAFAARESEARPATAERRERERRLREKLQDYLARAAHPEGLPPAPRVISGPCPPALRRAQAVAALRAAVARMPGARAAKRLIVNLCTSTVGRMIDEALAVGMTQKRSEISDLARRVRRLAPRRILEIGTSYGGTLYLWTRLARDDATVLSIDLPPWELDDPGEAERLRLLRGFRRGGQTLHLLRHDSHLEATRRAVVAELAGAPLDFLFIDGDHSYEGVHRDFADYGPLVRAGGLIAFHDIHPHSRGWGGEVARFWAEIRGRYRTAELIERRRQDGFGIGVVLVGGG
jgi:predicted O-methyltransferase YrrM